MYEGSLTWDEAARNFQVSKPLIGRILQKEKKRKTSDFTLSPNPPKKKGRKSQITSEMLVFLLSQIEANSEITLDNLATLVQEKFQIQISVSSIHRALEKMDVTWKNILPIPVNWNTPEIIRARSDYISKLEIAFRERKRIFLDESGFNLHIKNLEDEHFVDDLLFLQYFLKEKYSSLSSSFRGRNSFFKNSY